MSTTTATTSVPDDNSASSRIRPPVGRATTATLFALALATAVPAAASAGPGEEPVGCIVARTADSLGFDVTSLITTVRSYHGAVQILHEVACISGHSGTAWITVDLT